MRHRSAIKGVFAASAMSCFAIAADRAAAQTTTAAPTDVTILPEVGVNAPAATTGAYASQGQFHSTHADLGPLGSQSILTTPLSITVLPQDLLVNDQVRTVNTALSYLPSVEVRDQQGIEVSRPQSLGFQGTITENTRLDGLNIIGTTAIPVENLQTIQVLNGLAGSLYGPETPAGVFNYVLKRPTDQPLERFVESYDSNEMFTEEADLGGRTGANGWLGYRMDLVHGEGESWTDGSFADRTLASGAFDIHLDDKTVVQVDGSYYEDSATGLPGSFVYDGASTSKTNASTLLPSAPDPTRPGYGQPGAGTDLVTETGLVKVIHQFDDNWNVELGGLYQNAIRNLFGITNTLTDNAGDYTTTKNFTAVPHFTDGSNEAYLNGHVTLAGFANDVTLGTNGFINEQYNYKNSITTTLGEASIAEPVIFPYVPIPGNGGQYLAGEMSQQSVIEGDTLHLTPRWSIQAVFSESFLDSRSFNNKGQFTSLFKTNGVFSPTVSLIYRVTPRVTTYFTYAESVEESDQAPAGSANANAFLAPYHDTEYQGGVKYAVTDRLLLTLDGFSMRRPFADTVAPTNLFQVIGEQRNTGAEFFAQGELAPALSVFGGFTYIDARLLDTGVADTDGGTVVGVPTWKSDVTLDYHPAFLGGFALTGTAHYEGERAATNVKNQSFAPQFATLDVGVRYTRKLWQHHLTARVGALNVTDTRYFVSVADGNIVGSPGANTAYLGAPRVVLASLEVDL